MDEIEKYRVDNVANNLELRVKYMRNQIDKDDFESRIHRDNKKHDKKREIHEVLQMFLHTVTDIIYRARDVLIKNRGKYIYKKDLPEEELAKRTAKNIVTCEVNKILEEVETIRLYSNECFAEIAHVYGCKAREIVIVDRLTHYGDIFRFIPDPVKKKAADNTPPQAPVVA
jgi:nucleoid DNA-binding protein